MTYNLLLSNILYSLSSNTITPKTHTLTYLHSPSSHLCFSPFQHLPSLHLCYYISFYLIRFFNLNDNLMNNIMIMDLLLIKPIKIPIKLLRVILFIKVYSRFIPGEYTPLHPSAFCLLCLGNTKIK